MVRHDLSPTRESHSKQGSGPQIHVLGSSYGETDESPRKVKGRGKKLRAGVRAWLPAGLDLPPSLPLSPGSSEK